MTTGTVRPKCW